MTAQQIATEVLRLERQAEHGKKLARAVLDYALPSRGMIPVGILKGMQAKARRLLRANEPKRRIA